MLDKIKQYLFNVALTKYAPVAVMSGLTALGTLLAAHSGALEQWGVNYIASWTPDWLTTHQISGPILLVELDTTSTATIALVIALVTMIARAGEHHTMQNVPTIKTEGDTNATK